VQPARPRKQRLGWLGPAIVALGVAVAAVGVWWIITGKPKSGDVIDRIDVGENHTIVVRAEAGGGDRNFIELLDGERLVWQALVPPYAGRPGAPGIAWGKGAITVRVIREGKAEVFALAIANAAKLGGFKLAPGKGPVVKQTTGPVTLSDHDRSYELVTGAGWAQLVAIDLTTGEGIWKQDLAGTAIEAAGIDETGVWVRQAGARRSFDPRSGTEQSASRSTKSS
jgi:outer membrane protein assembly factor BamB